MAIQAAIEGQGVALAPGSIVAMDIAVGRLMRLFTDVKGIPTAFAYYVVSPRSVSGNPEVSAFREWIIQEIGQANPEPYAN
jgi:LysR family glycine cleavage system transcriptional activator